MYDVIVVGAGPAGSATAKRCAEGGLKTLVLEKRQLPRKKVCDAILGDIAMGLITEEFGTIPQSIFYEPPYLTGIVIHIPKYGSDTKELRLPQLSRSELDYWMCDCAKEKGAEVWEKTNFVGFSQGDDRYNVRIRSGDKERSVEARYLVGADGTVSRVRSLIFPDLHFETIQQGLDEFHTEIDLDKNYYHNFYDLEEGGLLGFSVHFKGDRVGISYAAGMGGVGDHVRRTHDLLAKEHGFDPTQEPVWSGRCLAPDMAKQLGARLFKPCKGNVLLTGDAGGFMLPVGEGIGPSVKSGLLAAQSILKASESGKSVESIYMDKLSPMLEAFDNASVDEQKMVEAVKDGGASLLEHFRAERASVFLEY